MWKSVKHKRAVEEVGYNSKIISEKEDIEKANFIILPGVGAFGKCNEFTNA